VLSVREGTTPSRSCPHRTTRTARRAARAPGAPQRQQLVPIHSREQPEHDRPSRLILLQVDQGARRDARLRMPPNSQIRSARSSSSS